jgi:hypothetical protein
VSVLPAIRLNRCNVAGLRAEGGERVLGAARFPGNNRCLRARKLVGRSHVYARECWGTYPHPSLARVRARRATLSPGATGLAASHASGWGGSVRRRDGGDCEVLGGDGGTDSAAGDACGADGVPVAGAVWLARLPGLPVSAAVFDGSLSDGVGDELHTGLAGEEDREQCHADRADARARVATALAVVDDTLAVQPGAERGQSAQPAARPTLLGMTHARALRPFFSRPAPVFFLSESRLSLVDTANALAILPSSAWIRP